MIDPAMQGAPPAMMQPPGPEVMDPGMDPSMAPPSGPPGMAPPETLDGPDSMAGPEFASTDPAQMAAIAMQIIGQMAQMDQQKLMAQIEQLKAEFAAQQQSAVMSAPQMIQQMIAQMMGGGPDMETLDGPASTLPMEDGQDPAAMEDPNAAYPPGMAA